MVDNNIGPGKYTNIDPSVSSRSARVTHGKFGQQQKLKYTSNDAPGPNAYQPNTDYTKPKALCNTMSKQSL